MPRLSHRLISTTSPTACATLALACALLSFTSGADDRTPAKPSFTDSEIRAILSHGPWPAPAPLDATNRVSGKHEAIDFGTKLFFDERLSGPGTKSCATCHVPERNWTDNLRRSSGVAEVDRNTPTLMNIAGSHWYGWDGAADSLWYQSLRPILDKRELAASPAHVAQLVRKDEDLSCRYRKTFGARRRREAHRRLRHLAHQRSRSRQAVSSAVAGAEPCGLSAFVRFADARVSLESVSRACGNPA